MGKSHDDHMILTCNVPLTLERRGGRDSDLPPAGGGIAGPMRRAFFLPPTVKEIRDKVSITSSLVTHALGRGSPLPLPRAWVRG